MVDQNSQFYAILTNVGAAKQANADALGIAWKITHMGVGDANGTDPTPNANQASLINEWRRAPLNQLKIDDKDAAIIVAEQVIPAEVGGRWIREIGLYDADGDLVAAANCPPTYKPQLSQGSGRTQVVRMNLLVSSSSNVQLKIDPGVVLATRQYVDQLTVRASQAEAEAGQENSKIMTPLRVFQAIAKVVKQATETAFGWAKIATQAQVDTGTDDTTIVSPKKLRATFARLGYLVDDAPYLNTFLKHSQAGNYIGFGGGNPKATAGVPELIADPTRNSLLNIEAFRPRADITFYRLWEATGIEYEGIYTEGAASINWRRVSSDGFPASELLAGPAKIATQAQVTAGTDDATIITPKKLRATQATQLEAEAGTDNTKTMTPLRVFQAIAKVVGQATEAAFGWAKIATQAQVTTGTDDATIITPKKLRDTQATQAEAEAGTDSNKWMNPLRVYQAIAKRVFAGLAYSSTPNGYIVLPPWMGGFVFQWGAFSHGEATNFVAVSVPFNIGFPATCYNVQCISDAGTTTCDLNGITAVNVGVTIAHRETSGPVVAGSLYWFAVGK